MNAVGLKIFSRSSFGSALVLLLRNFLFLRPTGQCPGGVDHPPTPPTFTPLINPIPNSTNFDITNCVYAPLGSISAKLCDFHKYLISNEFAVFLIHPVEHAKLKIAKLKIAKATVESATRDMLHPGYTQ